MARAKKEDGVNADDALIGQGVAGFLNTGLYKQILKKYGPGAIVKASDVNDLSHFRLPTGILSLDYGLSGGVAVGRVTIFFGPKASSKTTTSLRVLASAQSRCARCWTVKIHPATGEIVDCRCGNYLKPVVAFINVEATWDKHWAECVGVNTEEILYSQPDFGEQAVDIIEALVDSGHVHVVLLDSLAFLVPTAEIEKEAEGFNVGDQARLIAKCVRKTLMAQGRCEREHGFRPTILMTNQISHKVGVMWGCFHYSTRVTLADGTSEKIGKIVNQRLSVDVLSFDPKTGVCRPRKVTDWHINGKADRFLQFVCESSGGAGRSNFGVTPNHVLFGYDEAGALVERSASDFKEGDLIAAKADFEYNTIQQSVAIGSILGDGSLRRYRRTVSLRIRHGAEQTEYCKWKQSLLGHLVSSYSEDAGSYSFECRPTADWLEIQAEAYDSSTKRKTRRMSKSLLARLDWLAVAIWYMDDGSFGGSYKKYGLGKSVISVKSYSISEIRLLSEALVALGAPEPSISEKYKRLEWHGEQSFAFHSRIARFIHPSMYYKLHPKLRGLFESLEVGVPFFEQRLIPVRVERIYDKPRTSGMLKFDLTIEGDHCYLVDGVAVHNSPETTPGGFRPGFMASTEVRLAAKNPTSKEIDADVGAEMVTMEYRVVKQKTGVPFREGEFQLVTQSSAGKPKGSVYDEPQIVRLGEKSGLLTREGKTYTLLNKTFTRKEDIVAALLEDPLYAYNAREAILAKLLEDPDEPQA